MARIGDSLTPAGYSVGYKNPPIHTRFKKGECPNPKGRGKKRPKQPSLILRALRDTRVQIRIDGKLRRVSKTEYQVRMLARSAMKGDLQSAKMLLDLYDQSMAREADWTHYYMGPKML